MHIEMTSHRARRSQLLAGAASLLTVLLAASANAQSIDAAALRSAINKQSTAGGTITAEASTTSAAATSSAIQAGTASVADNQISASARANSAATTLDPTDGVSIAGVSPTALSIVGNASGGQADNLLANSQRMTFAPVRSTLLGEQAGITAGAVSSGQLAVTSNDLEATAIGNQAVDQLGSDNAGSGAGLVTSQTSDAASTVSANNTGVTSIAVTGASGSRLDLTGNTSLARAGGNVASDSLAVSATAVTVPGVSVPESTVSAPADDSSVAIAAYSNLGRQKLAGQVSATAGTAPTSFSVGVRGDLAASSATADGNALGATANGNQSSRTLSLTAGTIAGAGDAPSAIATVTNVQRAAGGVGAAANGATTVSIGGHLSASQLSASQNQIRASATANRADGNLLTVDANTLDTGSPASSGGLPWVTTGTAMTTNDGASSTTAAFSVQNVQNVAAGVSASVTAGRTIVATVGAVDHSSLIATGNVASGAAAGNSAINGATLHAGALRTSVDLNNAQTVDGSVRTMVGAGGDRAGATIEPVGSVAGSQLRVTDNAVTGTAVASSASNTLSVSSNTVSDGSAHVSSTAGSLDDGYGAAADLALANYQKFGTPMATGPSASAVTSDVAGKFAIGGAAYTNGSTLTLDGNSQGATAVANTALDRLSMTANSMPGSASPAAGTAVSSSQFGDGSVGANSDMLVIARGGVGNSSVSMSGNVNKAVAVMNDADNGLNVSAVQLDGLTGNPASIEANSVGAATAVGDHVLSGTQFASGTVGAAATTKLVNSDAGAAMSGSTFEIAGNSTIADVSANHAVNAVSVSGATAAGSDAGLANSQMSAAIVNASARTDATLGLSSTGSGSAIYGSSAAITGNLTQAVARGNSADNALTLNGPVNATDPGAGITQVSAFDTTAAAPAALVNVQSNYGSVTAGAGGSIGVPLNATGGVGSSSLAVSGNAMAATAYGNAVTNQVTIGGLGGAPGAVLSNVQTNSGPVSASVVGGSFTVRGGALSSGGAMINGNQLAASATGNIATSTITAGR
jgi:hypothetical protein